MRTSLPQLTLHRRAIAALTLLALGVALFFAAKSSAAFEPTVQVVGCSNSNLIYQAYDYSSTRHVAVNSAAGTLNLHEWSKGTSRAWVGSDRIPGFDANHAAHGATAVWYPLCIGGTEYPTSKKAYEAFKAFVTLLRQRTSAPLYVSATIGEQLTCGNARTQQGYVVDRAVAEGIALRGPDVAPADVPVDDCHFDPVQSINVQQAAVAFLDG